MTFLQLIGVIGAFIIFMLVTWWCTKNDCSNNAQWKRAIEKMREEKFPYMWTDIDFDDFEKNDVQMAQEDKQLLLIDLCGRLPYGVKCNVYSRIGVLVGLDDYGTEIDYGNGEDTTCEIKFCKPYLRPMSTMTVEEKNEYYKTFRAEPYASGIGFIYVESAESFDWLDKKMFDYRGLIPEDLAISTEVFNPYNN